MVTQAYKDITRHDCGAVHARRDSLHDGIGHRPIRPTPGNGRVSRGSPWALAPWPMLEVVKWVRDRIDRYLPGRGNRDVIAAAGDEPRAWLEAVMHGCVMPALREVRDQLAGEGYAVELEPQPAGAVLRTRGFNGREITYAVAGGVYREPVFSLAGTEPGQEVRRYARIDIVSRGARHGHRLTHCSHSAMRRDALHELRNQVLY